MTENLQYSFAVFFLEAYVIENAQMEKKKNQMHFDGKSQALCSLVKKTGLHLSLGRQWKEEMGQNDIYPAQSGLCRGDIRLQEQCVTPDLSKL